MTELIQRQTLPISSRPYAIFKPNEGRTLKVFEDTITYKSSISDTQWRFFEVVGSGNGGPPHTHPWGGGMYIVEGEVEVQLGDQTVLATPGYCIHIPAGIVHTYQIRSPQAKFFGWFPDTRAERCFEEIAQAAHLDPEAIAAISQKHHITPAEKMAVSEIKQQLTATVFKPNEGKRLNSLGNQVTYKSDHDNGWRFFEVTGSAGGQTPLHSHPWSEGFYVLEGEIDVQIEDQRVTAIPGYCLQIPSGTAHATQIRSPQAKIFNWASDSRVEQFVEAAAASQPDPAQMSEILQAYQVLLVEPS
jgi:quercetin dioxygenase-like cupin family protein